MNGPAVRGLDLPTGLAAAGAALGCWGLALGGYWPVAFALYGPRALPGAWTTLTLGVLLAGAGGALLAAALVAITRAVRPCERECGVTGDGPPAGGGDA